MKPRLITLALELTVALCVVAGILVIASAVLGRVLS
jgi:hypothetical protein